MSGRVGSITTDIISDGLVFNMDAANRASTIPSSTTTKAFNTINTAVSGSFINDTNYDSSTISPTFHFDGTGDYIILSSTLSYLTDVSKYTISMWFNADIVTGSPTVDIWLISQIGNSNNDRVQIEIYQGDIYHSHRHDGTNTMRGTTSVSANQWYNYTGVFTYQDPDTALKMYLNGSSVSPGNYISPTQNTPDNFSNTYIGARNTDYVFDGNIGPVHIYNRALSSTEVLHNYNALRGRFGL